MHRVLNTDQGYREDKVKGDGIVKWGEVLILTMTREGFIEKVSFNQD